METDKQIENTSKPWLWKKGQSGNIMGRPKGKTMKEYAREYLERMSDEERDEWLEGIEKYRIWELAEGKAHATTDGKFEVILPQPILGNVIPSNNSTK
jgi:hypothetical protein